jgi:hypothetical protein
MHAGATLKREEELAAGLGPPLSHILLPKETPSVDFFVSDGESGRVAGLPL